MVAGKIKIILFALSAVFVFLSCSKDDDKTIPTDGQYVADASDIFVGLKLKDGKCEDFNIYVMGERFDYKPTTILTKGSYPRYTYSIGEFSLTANFDSQDSFSGALNGVLRCEIDLGGLLGGGVLVFDEKTVPIRFVLDNTPSDADGNGILDSKQ